MPAIIRRHWPVITLSLLISSVFITVSALFFVQAREQMKEQIRERLRSVAVTAALQINGNGIDAIRRPQDMSLPQYQNAIVFLDKLRSSLPDIRFAYILRRTDDPDTLAFVADADAALTFAQLDRNKNNIIDPDEEAAFPGETYDVSKMPALRDRAFSEPAVDPEATYDQWGALISGYAPIRRSDGTVVAVLGIDMDAEAFRQLSLTAFSPSSFFLLFVETMFLAALIAVVWERRQIQMLSRINSERSGLLRLTFHQLGEPLTIMKWSLETLRNETENEHLRTLVDEHMFCMDEGLGRLNSIIDTLQLAEKVDLGSIEYLPSPSSLRALIDNIVHEWESSLHKRNQRIHILMSEDITLPVDKTLLSIVFRQLLVNAIEYSEDGSIISIIVTRQHKEVEISVKDEGCGIPHEDMPHLFEKYRRASNAHLRKPDGNGLGLYIAKGIVEKAGGKMHVESEEGRGTTITFTLPLS